MEGGPYFCHMMVFGNLVVPLHTPFIGRGDNVKHQEMYTWK
jgi:hypothetical protein